MTGRLEARRPLRHVDGMVWNDTRGRSRAPSDAPVLDMTPDGRFVEGRAARPSLLPARVMGIAILVAVIAGMLGFALLALWLALQLIPIAIGAGLIAYGIFRFQVWRARPSSRVGRNRDLRP
jgi:hypothetical protein